MANCFDTLDGSSIGETPEDCYAGDPPAMTPDFNTQYYNPEIRYFPAVSYDGSSKGDMDAAATTNWTLVPTDNVSSATANDARKTPHLGSLGSSTAEGTHWDTGTPGTPVLTMDLAAGYPDRVWCNSTGASATDTANCKTNSAYTYPEFTFGYGVDGSGNRKYKVGAPYYYRIVPTEFCTDASMITCVAATAPTSVAGVIYAVPARVRFCDSTAHTNCQAKRTSTFKYPKFLGRVNPSTSARPDHHPGRRYRRPHDPADHDDPAGWNPRQPAERGADDGIHRQLDQPRHRGAADRRRDQRQYFVRPQPRLHRLARSHGELDAGGADRRAGDRRGA
jgi:type IV pilus assembly protein PilY1